MTKKKKKELSEFICKKIDLHYELIGITVEDYEHGNISECTYESNKEKYLEIVSELREVLRKLED